MTSYDKAPSSMADFWHKSTVTINFVIVFRRCLEFIIVMQFGAFLTFIVRQIPGLQGINDVIDYHMRPLSPALVLTLAFQQHHRSKLLNIIIVTHLLQKFSWPVCRNQGNPDILQV
jgi:hypothetical protein